MTKRPQAHIRNPVLALPAVAALRRLDAVTRALLRQLLLEMRADARSRAEASWRRRKAPMAAYWWAVSVYAGHVARALGSRGIASSSPVGAVPVSRHHGPCFPSSRSTLRDRRASAAKGER